MDRIDIAIIGGGVVGLAVAAEIGRGKKDIFIFERNSSFGQEASSRNSEVIHSGIYYPKDSLKTTTCIEGNRLLYDICRDNGIAHNKTGKLIVASDSSETYLVENLFENGLENGLEDIRIVSSDEIRKMEPEVKATQGIFLPMTGIIDSHALMEYFLHKAKEKGVDIVYETEVVGIDFSGDVYRITVNSANGETYSFESKIIINSAGLNSDTVARMAGLDGEDYTLSYCKGDYFRITGKKSSFIKRLVYPVVRPNDNSLGIHVTPDLAGGLRLGPDAEYLSSRNIDYDVNPAKADNFYNSVKSFLPFLEKEDLSVDTSGVRPKLQGPTEGFRDFVIKHEDDKGLRGFIDLIGIESPGLTASPAIARKVKGIVDEMV